MISFCVSHGNVETPISPPLRPSLAHTPHLHVLPEGSTHYVGTRYDTGPSARRGRSLRPVHSLSAHYVAGGPSRRAVGTCDRLLSGAVPYFFFPLATSDTGWYGTTVLWWRNGNASSAARQEQENKRARVSYSSGNTTTSIF